MENIKVEKEKGYLSVEDALLERLVGILEAFDRAVPNTGCGVNLGSQCYVIAAKAVDEAFKWKGYSVPTCRSDVGVDEVGEEGGL